MDMIRQMKLRLPLQSTTVHPLNQEVILHKVKIFNSPHIGDYENFEGIETIVRKLRKEQQNRDERRKA